MYSTRSNSKIVAVAAAVLCLAAGQAGADVGSLGDSNGQIAAWGRNDFGELDVPAGTFTDVAGGEYHSLGVRTDGTLAGWGYDYFGQITVPSGTFTAVAAGDSHSLGLRTDGTLAGWGSDYYGQITVPSGTFTDIAAGGGHSLGVRTDGTLAGWGSDLYGQITVPSGTFTDIAGGADHSLGVRTDGTLAGWGSNSSGQSNVPSGTFTDIAAGGAYSLGVRTDGTLAGWGSNGYGATNIPSGTFTDIAAGFWHSLGLRTDGTLAGWGWNTYGQTNVPSGTFVAVEAGERSGLALRARTTYDDLLVNGQGVSDVQSWLNRHITVSGNATIQSTMYTANNPTMTVGGTITLTSGGTIQGSGSLLGAFTGEAGSTITATGPLMAGNLSGQAGFVHHGTLNVGTQNVLLLSSGTTTLGGATTIAGGQLGTFNGLTIADTGTITGYGSVLNNVINHGVITGSGGTLILPSVVSGDGDFLGMVQFSGLYAPGMSPASVTLGDPIFSGVLEMELGGTTLGSQYDHINITGTPTFGGTLSVVLIDGFTPQFDDYFDLFDGDLFGHGEFDVLSFPSLGHGLSWNSSTLYTDGIIRVEGVQAVPGPGALLLGLIGLAGVGRLRRAKKL